MCVLLIFILTLHRAHSACVLVKICTENAEVQAEIVDVHNAFRRAVQPSAANMLMMSYSEEIAVGAQAWVDRCILAHGAPSTRMLNGYELGENLYYSSYPFSWTGIITIWHEEVTHYNYPNGSTDGSSVGHYTQIVWNSSYRVGCGVAQCSNFYLYGCQYYRAGNFRGALPYKAGRPCASCPGSCVEKLCTNPCPLVDNFLNCPTLKAIAGCSNKLVSAWCPASCTCTTEIIPVG
ncbi:cysteine-rich venom protein pseudecin [Salarias fasciatus]|uniref:cysteine-rich venom protein pseudecin n=1 Tax=Salarias fasciatus TaxID=181472 RepID=UPI0011767006|nr:cysteine-rich venom protein pseudecin-like [Salarias fasciatus]